LNRALALRQVNDIWNRTKVSYTPMSASVDPKLLQIKGRAFEMGLSGTMMLCQSSPNLERYYVPGREFIAFDSLDDCMEKARYYTRHDAERQRIAQAYYNRTRAEHTWEHRWDHILSQIGMMGSPSKKVA
jgi:spore maturation protein CgeB